MMLTFKSFVKTSLFISALALLNASTGQVIAQVQGQSQQPYGFGNGPQEDTEKRLKAIEDRMGTKLCSWETDPQKKGQCLIGYTAGSGFNPQGNCQQAQQMMTDAQSKFVSACGKGKVRGGGTSGHIACSAQLLSCTRCGGEDTGDLGDIKCDQTPDALSDTVDAEDTQYRATAALGGNLPSITGQRIRVAPDRATAMDEYKTCPDLAKEDLDKYTKEVQDQKKEFQDLQEKQAKGQESLQDMQTKFQAQMDGLDEKAQQVQDNAKEEVQKLSEQLTEDQQKVADDVTKMEAQITSLIAKKDEENIAKQMNAQKLSELQATADLNCHDSALKKVDALRTQRLAQMDVSQYTSGSFNNLMKGVGLDTRQKSQLLTQQYYNWCIQDMSYKRLIANGQQKYNIDNNASNVRLTTIDRQIQTIRTQITNLRTSRLQQMSQTTLNRMQRAQDKMNTTLNNLSKTKSRLQDEYNKKIVLKQQEMQRLNTQVAEAQDYLSQKRNYLSVRNSFAKGQNVDNGGVSEAISQMGNFASQIPGYYSACCSGGTSSAQCPSLQTFYCTKYSGIADGCLQNGGAAGTTTANTGNNNNGDRRPATSPTGAAPAGN